MYLFPHNPNWPTEYQVEKKALDIICENQATFYHIGSTAIEGLYAKDCIDILGVVNNLSEVERWKAALIDSGYVDKGSYGVDGRAYFSKTNRKVHLHIFQTGDFNIEKHLNFVRVMKASPQKVQELNILKTELHHKFPNDKSSYQAAKLAFYHERHRRLNADA